MRKRVVFAAIAVIGLSAAITAVAVSQFRGGDDDTRLRAFFTLPTRSSCDASSPTITVDSAHFSAFVPDSAGRRSKQGKFLIVTYTTPGSDAAQLSGHFILAVPPGDHYQPLSASSPSTPTASSATELVFDVPQDLGAAKLVFDDGCSHEEWLAP
jgi:hypothetical protein